MRTIYFDTDDSMRVEVGMDDQAEIKIKTITNDETIYDEPEEAQDQIGPIDQL